MRLIVLMDKMNQQQALKSEGESALSKQSVETSNTRKASTKPTQAADSSTQKSFSELASKGQQPVGSTLQEKFQFGSEKGLGTESDEQNSEGGCSQQNQTSGFAQQREETSGDQVSLQDQQTYGAEEGEEEEQEEEYADEEGSQAEEETLEDPSDLTVYPKKEGTEPENMTFQGKFENRTSDKKSPPPNDGDNSESSVEEDIRQIKELGEKAKQLMDEPEQRLDTADLLTHSEKAAKKRTDKSFLNNLESNKQANQVNLNMISYQTANFGSRSRPPGDDSGEKSRKKKDGEPEKMFASMSDLNFVEPANSNSKKRPPESTEKEAPKKPAPASTGSMIISPEQKAQMRDVQSNWKVRTSTIDDIHISIQQAIDTDPDLILREAESLLDFFVSLLSDQNFKIVLMTLSIINLVISMPQHTLDDKPEGLTPQFLSRCVPRLVSKLSDSKNIIRQQAIRALMGIFLIMRAKTKHQKDASKSPQSVQKGSTAQKSNNFVSLVLPYLQNSQSWHIREELLNVLIICFLKSKNFYEFDAYKVFQSLLLMLDDSKDRIRFTALEAIVAFVSIGNKLSAKEIINQLADKQISELIAERLEAQADMTPYLNDNGALEMPYLEHIELAANQMMFGQNQRREGLNSGPASQMKQLNTHLLAGGKRGSSSGQKNLNPKCPPSANSLVNVVQNANGGKRTASANNPKEFSNHLQVRVGSNHGSQHNPQANIQSPIYNVFGSNGGNAAFSDFNASAASYNPLSKQQFSASIRITNTRVTNNDRFGSGPSLMLPQLQRKSSIKNNKQETPSHNNVQTSNFYGHSQNSPRETVQGMQMRGPPSSENRFFSHQSEPGSSFYSSNYQKKVSAQNISNQLMSAPGALNLVNQTSQNSNGSYIMQGAPFVNNLSNHPIHLLSKDQPFEAGIGIEDADSNAGYLGIKHPPVQLINHYYQQSNQLNLIHQTFSSQSRAGSSSHQSSGLRIHHPNMVNGQSYEVQTVSSYYSRKDVPSTDAKSFMGSALQSSANVINNNDVQRPNSNRAANGQGMGVLSNGSIAPKSGGSMGEGPLLFTPETRGNSSGLGQQVPGVYTGNENPRQQKLFKIGTSGVTFYSDGSMMTATTGATSHAANKLLKSKQLSVASNPGNEMQQPGQQWGGTSAGLGFQQRGPIKATRQMQVKNVERPQPPGIGNSIELCIDSRKPKRPIGSEGYNDTEEGELDFDLYGQETTSRNSQSQIRREEEPQNSEAQDATILSKTYLPREELEPIKVRPEKAFQKAINSLVDNVDWNVQFDACNTIRQACKHHQNLLLQNGATLHLVVKQLCRHADSLRSAIAKIALITINDLFFYLKRCMDTYLDPLTNVLMKKSADTNEFIMSEADAALATMCQVCQDQKVLLTVLGQQVNSKSNQARLAICKCLEFLVQSLGNHIMFFSSSDKLIAQLANFIADPCQEVRNVAKRAFLALSKAVVNAKDLEKLLLRVLSEAQYKKVRSYLDNEPMNYDHNSGANFVIKNSNVNPGSSITGFGITNAAQSQGQNGTALNQKTLNQMRASGAAKGTLRTGIITGKAAQVPLASSMSGSALSLQGEPTPQQSAYAPEGQNLNLNIKATAIINPKKIIRVDKNEPNKGSKPTIKLKGTNNISQISLNSAKNSEAAKSQAQFQDQSSGSIQDQVRELQQKMMMGDWRSRQDTADSLFTMIEQNTQKFAGQAGKCSEVADLMCKLMTDQNAKIQVSSLERFSQLAPSIAQFIEWNINLFFGALTSNLASTNSQIRKLTDQAFAKVYENVSRQQLLGPLLNAIQFQSNVRVKPQLIDHLSDYICDSCQAGVLQKQTLPLAYKLLDDTRNEVKLKTEKLLKKLHFLLGQQVIDQCPSTKLQRVCEVVLNSNINLNAHVKLSNPVGGGTFGASAASSMVVQASSVGTGSAIEGVPL